MDGELFKETWKNKVTKNHFFKVTYVHNSIGKTFKVCKDFPFFFLEYDIVTQNIGNKSKNKQMGPN